MLLNVRKKMQSVVGIEKHIDPSRKNMNLKRKTSKGNLPDVFKITCQKPKGERSHGQEELMKKIFYRKKQQNYKQRAKKQLPKYSTIESIVVLGMQEDK